MSGHAKLAPSAATRWINCPGSINLCEKAPPQASSGFADEGTAAHALAEMCLKQKKGAADFVGTELYIDEDDLDNSYTVTEQMAEHVQIYLDGVSDVSKGKHDTLLIEEKLCMDWLIADSGGTSDAIVWDFESGIVHVWDLKFGQGLIVEPEWNNQAMIYALGALHKLWSIQTENTRKATPIIEMFTKIVISIAQPRAFHPDGPIRKWTVSVKDLMYWGLNVLKPAALATNNKDAKLCVGEHCRFCNALAICPEQARNAFEIAKVEFSDSPMLPNPESMDQLDVVRIMNLSEIFSNWAKEVKRYAEGLLQAGEKVPGYKLVSRKSNRKWTSPSTAEQILSKFGDFVYEPRKLLSVAQMEKALKKNNISTESAMVGLVVKPDAGVTIAPVSDKRKEIIMSCAELDFIGEDEMFN